MTLYNPYTSKRANSSSQGSTEFDILKGSHKFLREDGEPDESRLSWDDRLAKKYYSSLYREYAVCDLKHYKSGNFALRWRTEEEVLSGAGETTCGNTRCPLHKEFPDERDDIRPALTTLELPFSYMEHGESKFALVKVVLCTKCCKKLMWKRNKEKEAQREHGEGQVAARPADERDSGEAKEKDSDRHSRRRSRSLGDEDTGHDRYARRRGRDDDSHENRRKRSSRSRSPLRRKDERLHRA